MRAGNLRRRITIQRTSSAKDSFGQFVDTDWQDVVRCWAQISVVTAREISALGSGFTSQVSHRVTLRFPTQAVTAGMRVKYKARLFQVQAASDPTEDQRQLDLLCLEVSK
jgi:SPP1 family predicted phage head-tail adaptor